MKKFFLLYFIKSKEYLKNLFFSNSFFLSFKEGVTIISTISLFLILPFLSLNAQQTFNTYDSAKLVIGQSNFTSSSGVCTQSSTNGPSYCAISSKGMLAICDQTGSRVNIWKSPFIQSGQLQDVVLGSTSFTNCSSGLSQTKMYLPNGVAFSPDGNKLIVSDLGNNRVLIWNSIPTINGQAADVVIGQTNFTDNSSGTSQNKFSYPAGVFVSSNGKLFVSDRRNNRVLIWNSIPTANGQSADAVVGQTNFTSSTSGNAANQMSNPWGVWVSPQGKLLVAEEDNNRVIIFNSIPTSNGVNADVVVGQSGFGISTGGIAANKMSKPLGVTLSPDGKLAIGEFSNHRIIIYNIIPSINGASADVVLGQPNFTTSTPFYPSGLPTNRNMQFLYNVSFDLYGRLFVVGRDMNRGMIFGDLPAKKAELSIKIVATSISICAATPTTNVVTVINNGPDTATNVVSTSSLPASFSYASHTTSSGTYTPASGYWNIPSVPPGDSVVLTINGNSTTSGTFIAYANIIQSNQLDLNLSNNGTNVTYTAAPGLNCIFTDSVSSLSLCAGTKLNVSYTKAGTFNTGNFFTAELSDAAGSFFRPTALDSISSTLSGAITATIPLNTPVGTNYRIRVRSSNPAVLGADNGRNITINNNDSISVTTPVLSNAGRRLTASVSAKFPQYEWYRNGTVLPGIITGSYYASLAGAYTVSYTSNCGISPQSNSISFTVNSQPQTITFPTIPSKTYTDSPFVLHATASSLLPVTYSMVSGPGTLINDTTVRITGVGSILLKGTQAGNNVFDTAVPVIQTIVVAKASQTITFPAIADTAAGATSITLTATASSGLPVVYSVLSGPGTISANTLFYNGVGLITVRASQPGNAFYNAATPKDVAFCIVASQPSAITGNTEVCINSVTTYSVASVTGANFIWSVDGGGTILSSGNTASVQWTSTGTHTISVKYTTNCGTEGAGRSLPIQVTNKTLTGSFIRMLPSDGNTNVSFPITFSWFPIVNAVYYNIYIWPEAATKPLTPTIANISGITYTLYSSSILEFGKAYKWQVVAKSICDELPSPVQTFRLKYLPDLIVNDIQVPATGFSGQSISIKWEVKNTGLGATLDKRWVERLYLSKDALLDDQDINLGTADNVSALSPNGSYVQTASFTLPQGISDNYYVIVVTDSYNQLAESNETNNTTVSTSRSAIQLTPPPDLQVTSIVSPNVAFSGQGINVTWKIANAGTGQTVSTSWTDLVYLSKDPQFNGSAKQVGTFNHTGALGVNAFYTQSGTFQLPEGMFGAYYIHVVTDAYKQVYEHAFEGNNTRTSDSIHVILTPPIDLFITQVAIPQFASNRQNILINWRVENQGGSSTENRRWTDFVYLSKTTTFNPDSAVYAGSFTNPISLAPGEGYNAQINYTVPAGLTGAYYVYVKTDANNNVFEYTYENNNITRSPQTINILTPDLTVSNIVSPAADTSGRTINVAWTVRNNGTGTLVNTSLTDRIVISTSPTYNASNITELKQFTYTAADIAAGATLTQQTSVKLPNGISGSYYLYVITNFNNSVYESSKDNNTARSANPVVITLGPWSDLQVRSVTAADSATAGDVIPLTYTVGNKEKKLVNDPVWTDKIYISMNAVWNPANSTFIRGISQNRLVAKDSSYTVNTSISLPAAFADTTCYIYVFTDADNNVYEYTDEGNNVSRSKPLYIKKYPPVDLAVTSIAGPDSGRTGAPIIVRWTVINKGKAITLPGQWSDGLFLSTDTIWDYRDRLVKDFTHRGSLAPGSSYSSEESFTLPNGLAGTYYLLLVIDYANVNNDADRSNNYKLIKQSNNGGGGGNGDPVPIVIVLTKPADLVVTKLIIPDEGIAGQPVKVIWTVKNTGTGPTAINTWTEKIVLSTDLFYNAGDRSIGTFSHTGILKPGEEYTDSLMTFLPIDFAGNYILIFKADAYDNIYENGAEDNTAFAPITITKAPLSDLNVTNIQVPQLAMAGDTVTINWMLKNTGANPSTGYMQEGVYLSEDTVKDVNDILLGSTPQSINIGPGAEVVHSFSAELKGVSLRNYYAIVHTDILNNISETSDSNNVSASVQTMMVTVPPLPINVLTRRNLQKNKEVYYRIEVPDSLAGESLLIALKGDSVNGSNELYLRYGQVPTRAVYDYSHSQPYQGNQEIIVPELKAGTYYLMVSGSTSAGSVQPVSLLASVLKFEIRMVDAGEGGNTGQVTLQVSGSKLGTVNSIRLIGKETIQADSINIIDPTKVFATFNLNGAALGAYDVVAKNAKGDTAALKKGFTIVPGTAANLVTNVVTPPNTRPSNVISITVEYTNAGNTDLINPVLKLTSLGGAPIGFNVADLVYNTKELTLALQELNGPVAILRPGASGTIIVYAKATTVLGFALIQSHD